MSRRRRDREDAGARPAAPAGGTRSPAPAAAVRAAEAPRGAGARTDRLLALLLAALALAVFLPALRCGFVNWDDNLYVTNNTEVQAGLTGHGLIYAFTSGDTANWHPLTWLSHMSVVAVAGMNPVAHHLASLLLHALAVAMLFLALREMTAPRWPSALAAALFAIHPTRVESVVWISERKDVLSGLFFVLALLAYGRAVHGKGRPLSVAVWMTLGLLTKPVVVSLPFVLLLLDIWPLRRFEPLAKRLIEKIPLFALSAVSSAVTWYVQSRGGAVTSIAILSLTDRAANAPLSYIAYLRMLVWPVGLAAYYEYPRALPMAAAAICGLAVVLLTAVALDAFHRRPAAQPYAVGWLWYAGAFVPMIGLVQVGLQSRADRYTYLPYIGIFLAVAVGAGVLAARSAALRTTMVAASVATLALCAVLTVRQTGYWTDSLTLWNRTIAVTGLPATALRNRGLALQDEGKEIEAAADFEAAIRANNRYTAARRALAELRAKQGRLDEAIVQYQEIARLRPSESVALYEAGRLLVMRGRYDEAIDSLNRAIRLNDEWPEAQHNLGVAFRAKGRTAEAVAALREAVRLDPKKTNSMNLLAWILATDPGAGVRDGTEAERLATQACALTSPEDAGFLDTLAAAQAEAGHFDLAVATAARAESVARAAGRLELARGIAARGALYRAGVPFRDTPPPR